MAESQIDSDLPCETCGYNLRALPLSRGCPECGAPVMDSFRSAALKWQPGSADRSILNAFAATINSTSDAVLFVKDAIHRALLERCDLRRGNQPSNMTAADICHAVADYAADYFNDRQEALELLREWKIEASEDVGRIVFALVATRQFSAASDESPADFYGLFTLHTLFPGDFCS